MDNKIDEDQILVGDSDRISQVLINLLTNARKYVPVDNGRITIESELKGSDESQILQISVSDNGPGIATNDIRKLFKPFSKLEANSDLNPNGIGLGLSICKLVCNNLGGDIIVTSDKGTKFTFWVEVKILRDYDLYLEQSHMPGVQIDEITI